MIRHAVVIAIAIGLCIGFTVLAGSGVMRARRIEVRP
jgi:hypothetical protein